MTAPVFVADNETLTPPWPVIMRGGVTQATLSGSEARHALVVKRLESGEACDIVDGHGVRLRCHVAECAHGSRRDALTVIIDDVLTGDDHLALSSPLILIQALAKGGRDEQAVETATEVGVHRVIPWQAQRSISRWSGPKAAKGQAKWASTAREAAKQARRSWIPRVDQVKSTDELCREIAQLRDSGVLVALLHEEAREPFSVLRAKVGECAEMSDPPAVAVIVGPEGGIGPEETDQLVTAGAVMVRLGPHVMRTASAGPTALALYAHGVGLWEQAPALLD